MVWRWRVKQILMAPVLHRVREQCGKRKTGEDVTSRRALCRAAILAAVFRKYWPQHSFHFLRFIFFFRIGLAAYQPLRMGFDNRGFAKTGSCAA
jgi:hypothetical protein